MACETKEQFAEQEGVHAHHPPSTESSIEKKSWCSHSFSVLEHSGVSRGQDQFGLPDFDKKWLG